MGEKRIKEVMKKVLLIIPSNTGTIGLCSLNLYNALRKIRDIEVKAVMVHKYDKGYEEFNDCDSYMKGTGSFIKNLFQSAERRKWLKRIKESFTPDLSISTLSGCSTLNVRTGGKDYKIGVFHAPNTQIKGLWLQYLVSQLSYRFIYPKLDKLFCVNRGLYDFFIDNYPWIDQTKIDVVYNVHPIEKIKKLSIEELDNENERAIFSNYKVILFCGRLEYVKAPQRLLRAFGQSGLPHKGFLLVFMGHERQVSWEELRGIANEMSIESCINYIGAKANPYKYMSRASVLVSSSKSEGLPGVLIESLALGKPIVTTNSSRGVWEILSCDDKYDADLKTRKYFADGIITPNTDDESLNIEQLALALNEIVDEKYKDVKAPFLKKVTEEYITNKYLNCIK